MNDNASGLLSTREASIALTVEATCVSEGRNFVGEVLRSWGLGFLCEAVVLVASELITNVLLHTDSPPLVYLVFQTDRVRLGIADSSPFMPQRRSYALDSTTGRGMVLVESMATNWSVENRPDGKVVWCEFAI